jgi:hypothetical protein
MRRRLAILSGHRRVVAVAVVAVLVTAVGALAYWAASGSGTASGSVGTLNAPTEVSASSTGGSSTVAVSWTASAPSNGLLPTGYYVKRWSGGTPTVAGGTCGSPGSPVNQTSCNDTSVADGTYTYTVVAVYHSWTAESTHSSSVTVASDVTPPTDSLSLSEASGAFLASETLYFKGNAAGQFNLVDTVSDSGTGPASATFPALSATNWTTHSAETVSTPSGGPYSSSTFKWSPSASPPATYTVTSKDNAGNTSAGSTLTFVSDTTAPTSGAVSVNGTAATSGAGSSSFATSTGFTIGSRTEYTDSGSGLASSILTIQSETYTNGTCGAPGSGGPYATAQTISGTTNPSITAGFCYLYTLTGTDNVGNAISISTTVAVDTTAPSTPTLSFGGLSSNAFYASGNNTLFFRPAAGGTYTVTASSTDSESGIKSGNAGYTFSSLAGNNFTLAQTAGQGAYTFGESATQPGSAPTIFATNNAGLNSAVNATYNLVKDTTAPTGSVTVPAYSNSTTVSVTFSSVTDSQSGVNTASGQLSRATASYNSSTGVCGTFGTFSGIGSAGPTSPYSDSGLSSGSCYEYKYTVSDNVGNAATLTSGSVAVDASAPTITALATANHGTTAGKMEKTDTITITLSKQMAAQSICSAWTNGGSGAQSNSTATVHVTGNSEPGNNVLSISAWTSCGTFHFGSIDLGTKTYVTSTGGSNKPVDFTGSTIAYDGTAHTLTVTLGTASTGGGAGTLGTVSSSVLTLTLDPLVTDLAGNATSPNTKATGNVEQF